MANEYVSNSLTKRNEKQEEKPQVQKVTKGVVKAKPQTQMQKIGNEIIKEGKSTIINFVIYDVLLPTLKDTTSKILKGSIDLLFYGETRDYDNRRGSSRRQGGRGPRVSYDRQYDYRDRDRREQRQSVSRSYDNVGFASREDADNVLGAMDDQVDRYGSVSIAGFFELCGLSSNNYTDNDYGWHTTNGMVVDIDKYGEYYIKLPKASPLRNR